MSEIPLPEERIQPWPEIHKMYLVAVAIKMAKALAKQFSIQTLRKIDSLNKSVDENTDSLWNFVDPVEMFVIFQKACDDSKQNWHNPHFNECWTLLKKDGYAFFAEIFTGKDEQ